MDPLSISVGIASLVKICAQAVSTCRDILNKFQDAPRIISTLQSECSTTRESLALIYMLINKSDTKILSNLLIGDSLAQSFDIALTGCTVTLSVLDNELLDILKEREHEGKSGLRQKAKYIWNEDALTKGMNELRGQRDALNLLVTVVQSHSINEIIELLRGNDRVFKNIRRNANIMRTSAENYRRASDDELDTLDTYSIFSEGSEEMSDFNNEILKSRAYRNVYDSVKQSQSRRLETKRRSKPAVDLLEEELIDLRDYPVLNPSYSEELYREMLAGNKTQNVAEKSLSHSSFVPSPVYEAQHVAGKSPSHSSFVPNKNSEETIQLVRPDLKVATAVQQGDSSNLPHEEFMQQWVDWSSELLRTSENSDLHRGSSQESVQLDTGSPDTLEPLPDPNPSPVGESFIAVKEVGNPEEREDNGSSSSASHVNKPKETTKLVSNSNQQSQNASLTRHEEAVRRAASPSSLDTEVDPSLGFQGSVQESKPISKNAQQLVQTTKWVSSSNQQQSQDTSLTRQEEAVRRAASPSSLDTKVPPSLGLQQSVQESKPTSKKNAQQLVEESKPTSKDAQQMIKAVLVGDGYCGIWSLCSVFALDKFPQNVFVRIFESFLVSVVVDRENYDLSLWITAGQEDYDRLRPLSYSDTDVAIVCFAIDNPGTLVNVQEKWIPEIRKHMGAAVPVILAGCKSDLRDNERSIQELQKIRQKPVTTQEGEAVSRKIGASRYVECSAMTNKGVSDVFWSATRAAVKYKRLKAKRESGSFRMFRRSK